MLQQARHWEVFYLHEIVTHENLDFLHSLLPENLPPKFIRRKILLQTWNDFKARKQFQKKMLMAMYDNKHIKIISYKDE